MNQIQSHNAFTANEMRSELGLRGQVLYCAAAGGKVEPAAPSDHGLERPWALGVAVPLNH